VDRARQELTRIKLSLRKRCAAVSDDFESVFWNEDAGYLNVLLNAGFHQNVGNRPSAGRG
jgi:hypothetical protein